MRDYGFKYKLGDLVTPVGSLTPVRQPSAQPFRVVTQLLVAGPVCEEHIYFIHPVHGPEEQPSSSRNAVRVQEEHLAPWSGNG